MIKKYPYAYHIALDGNGINGLEGMAGVCLFLFDPEDNSYGFTKSNIMMASPLAIP